MHEQEARATYSTFTDDFGYDSERHYPSEVRSETYKLVLEIIDHARRMAVPGYRSL